MMTTGLLKLLLRSFTGPVIVTSLLSVVFHLVLNQVPGSLQISKKSFKQFFQVLHTYVLHITIGLPLVGVLLASLLFNKDAIVYLEKKYGNILTA